MKILITDDIHPVLAASLQSKGHEVDDLPLIENAEVLSIIETYQGLVVSTKTLVNKTMIDAAPSLQFIARVGSGMENIDVEYATSRGIRVVSSPEGNANAVAEHALGLLIGLLRHIPLAHEQVRQGLWIREDNRGLELQGRTLGIIGFGHTGSAFASKLRGLSMTVLAHDKYKSGFGNEYVQEASLQDIQEKAEIVSLHLPLTHETNHYVDAAFLNAMHHPFFLLNTSRGKIVDTGALLWGIQNGYIRGAAIRCA
jgi:D-3-phosphoglycerate dehydrogenase